MTPPEPTRLAWLKQYTRTNPLLALWGLMLFCGGSVLLSYHAGLAYLPDFNLVELAGLMASVTLIGLMLVVLFVLSCFVPGLTLRWIEHAWPLVPYERYFTMQEFMCLWLVAPLTWAAYLWLPAFIPAHWLGTYTPAIFFAALVLGSIIAAFLFRRKGSAAFKRRHWKYRLVSRHAVAFAVWIALFVFPIGAALSLATAGDASREIPVAIWGLSFLMI